MLTHRQVTVDTTVGGILIIQGVGESGVRRRGTSAASIKNTGAKTCYVGGSGVTSASGFPVAVGDVLGLSDLGFVDILYAICGAGDTTTLAVLEIV